MPEVVVVGPHSASTEQQIVEPWTNRRIFTVLAIGTLIVALLWRAPDQTHYIGERAGEVFLTIVLAMSCTYLLRPVVDALNRTKWCGSGSRSGRAWATLIVFLIGILIIVAFVLIALKPITDNVRTLWHTWFVASTDVERQALVAQWQQKLQTALAPIQNFLPVNSTGDIDIPFFVNKIKNYAAASFGRWFTHVGFLVEILLIPVLVFYFLTDGPAIRAEANLLLPLRWRERTGRMADHFDRVFAGYIRGQVIMCIIAWIFVTVGLLALQVKYAFTLGLFAGITRGVPVIGPLLGGIPIVLVCMLTTGSLATTIIILIGFTGMHFLESKVLLPKIVGHEVDLHPVSVIVALLLGMEFFGFMGIFLAVPVAALFKIILTELHEESLARITAQKDAAMTQEALRDAALAEEAGLVGDSSEALAVSSTVTPSPTIPTGATPAGEAIGTETTTNRPPLGSATGRPTISAANLNKKE